MTAKRKSSRFDEMMRIAFPEHELPLCRLREAAYIEKTGQEFPTDVSSHVECCERCREQLAIMRRTDPILTGEWDNRVKVLVNATHDPAIAEEIAVRVQVLLGNATVDSKVRSVAAGTCAELARAALVGQD